MKKILIPMHEVNDLIVRELGEKYGFPLGLIRVNVALLDGLYKFEVEKLDE